MSTNTSPATPSDTANAQAAAATENVSLAPGARFDAAKAKLQPLIDRFGEGDTDYDSVLAAADDIATECKVRSTDLRNWAKEKMDALRATCGGGGGGPSAPAPAGAAPVPNPPAATTPSPLPRVLDMLVRVIQRQVVLDTHAAIAIALWIVGTFGFQGATIFPRLAITSPTKRCGKSTLLTLIGTLVSNPLKADNASPAAIFRALAFGMFTLLIDEVDAFFSKSDEMRGLVNAGFEKTGAVLRAVPTPDGKSFRAEVFKVFAPIVLAGIGGLPDTVLDRSIMITLQRAPNRGTTTRRPLRARDLDKLRAALVPHLISHAPAVEAALAFGATNIPPGLSDRAADCWAPLLAIADLAGGAWPARARAAAVALSGGGGAPSQRELLLADLRGIVDHARGEAVKVWLAWAWGAGRRQGSRPAPIRHIRSTVLVSALMGMEDRPWPEYGRDGKGITPQRLATMLKPFGIAPTTQRVPVIGPAGRTETRTEPAKVYSVSALRRIFRQYLQ
jgi:hypothetical protein